MGNPNQPGQGGQKPGSSKPGQPGSGGGQGGQRPGQPGSGGDWQNPKRQQNPNQAPQRPNKNPDQR